MHKACCSIWALPYCFARSSFKFQGQKWQKMPIFNQIERFHTVTPVWIHRWLWNGAQNMTSTKEVTYPFLKVIYKISRSHETINCRFEPNRSFLDCKSWFNSRMIMKSGTKLEVGQRRCSFVFHGYLSNFKATQDKKRDNFYPNWEFPVCNWFKSTDGYKMIHKVWRTIEDVLYCFSMSSVKFQAHTDKIKSQILTRIRCFRTVFQVWIYQWLWNVANSLHSREEVPCCSSTSSIQFQVHRGKRNRWL